MNKSFNYTTLRLSPVKALIELQHQANHIKNIINPRKISSQQTSREQEKKKIYSSYLESKFQKQRRQSIQRENERIIKDCVEIYKTKGILQKAEEDFKSAQKSTKRSLVNSLKAKEKMDLLKKQNKSFREKIQKLKPLVGDKQQWKKHEVFTSELVEKLRNTGKTKVYNNEIIMRIALSSEKEKISYFSLFKTLSFDKRQNSPKQENRKAEIKTAREKRKRRRILKKKLIEENLHIQEKHENQKGPESIPSITATIEANPQSNEIV